MRTTFRVIATTVLLSVTAVSSFAAEIVAGPMLGYSTMREVAVWVQLDDAAQVQLEYWQKDSDQRKTQPTRPDPARARVYGQADCGRT